eukprot:2601621-Amphidinium_carterae.1
MQLKRTKKSNKSCSWKGQPMLHTDAEEQFAKVPDMQTAAPQSKGVGKARPAHRSLLLVGATSPCSVLGL